MNGTMNRLGMVCLFVLMVLAGLVVGTSAPAEAIPPLQVPEALLDAAVSCRDLAFRSPFEPVLLVHGTGSGPGSFASNLGASLPALGFDVCTVALPGEGQVDIQLASEYVVHAVRKIAMMSGKRVDLVGHSQGGIEIRWAVKWWPDVQRSVDDLVTMGTTNHGGGSSALYRLLCLVICLDPALLQQSAGSLFLNALNSGDETPGEVSYTSIWSYTDEIVQLGALGARTSDLTGASNFAIQDFCPLRVVSHNALLVDAVSVSGLVDALSMPGPFDPTRLPPTVCSEGKFPVPADGIAPEANLDLIGPTLQGAEELVRVLVRFLQQAGNDEPTPAPYVRSN